MLSQWEAKAALLCGDQPQLPTGARRRHISRQWCGRAHLREHAAAELHVLTEPVRGAPDNESLAVPVNSAGEDRDGIGDPDASAVIADDDTAIDALQGASQQRSEPAWAT